MTTKNIQNEGDIDLFFEEVEKTEPCVVYTYLDEAESIVKVLHKDTAEACLKYIQEEIAQAAPGDHRILEMARLKDFAANVDHLH